MKRLQLPQNKLARLAINVGFIVFWFFFSLKVINRHIVVPILNHVDLLWINGSRFTWWFLFIGLVSTVLPMLVVTYFIFLRKLQPRLQLNLLLAFGWIIGYSIFFVEIESYLGDASIKIGNTYLFSLINDNYLIFYFLPLCLGGFLISAKIWGLLKRTPRITRSKDDAE